VSKSTQITSLCRCTALAKRGLVGGWRPAPTHRRGKQASAINAGRKHAAHTPLRHAPGVLHRGRAFCFLPVPLRDTACRVVSEPRGGGKRGTQLTQEKRRRKEAGRSASLPEATPCSLFGCHAEGRACRARATRANLGPLRPSPPLAGVPGGKVRFRLGFFGILTLLATALSHLLGYLAIGFFAKVRFTSRVSPYRKGRLKKGFLRSVMSTSVQKNKQKNTGPVFQEKKQRT
jgi:hypothetical protein